MGKDVDVPLQVAVRFLSEDRTKAIASSMRKTSETNVSAWVRDAIDLRIYLEQRGYASDFILSGDFLQMIEELGAKNSEMDYSNIHPLTDMFTQKNVEELIKAQLRVHAMVKKSLETILKNPNINTSQTETYESVERDIREKAEKFYMSVFNK